MSESVVVSSTETTEASNVSTSQKNDKDNVVTLERTVPVKDQPAMGESITMPPLVVKQIGVQKPGATPTAGSVSFDYSGPPVKVTNSTVSDLVSQFGIQNAWLAVLKLSGYNVTKETGEPILPIKRFREKVRKLKQTVETLKSRSDDSTTFLSKEFLPLLTATNNQKQNDSKGYSHTDAVIESILKQAVNESNIGQPSGPSTTQTLENTKTKRKPKKGKTDVTSTASTSTAPTAPQRASSATIDDVVSSVMNKIRNNEPFDAELNIDLPTSPPNNPQPQVIYTPQITPGQTFVMLQDDQMVPVIPQTVAQSQSAKPTKSKKKTKSNQTPQQPQIVQYQNYIPQQPGSIIRSTTSNTAPQPVTIFTLSRGQPTSTAPATFSVAPEYTTAGGNQAVIFSNINDIVRSPGISSPGGQITKVVTYQPGVQYPQQFITNSSPMGTATSSVLQASPNNNQGQYIMQTAIPQSINQTKQTPTIQQQQQKQINQVSNENNDDNNKKGLRRKNIKNTKSDSIFMENFNESDFEELATPKRKEAIKKLTKKKDAKTSNKKSSKAEKTTTENNANIEEPIKENEKQKNKTAKTNKKKPTKVVSDHEDSEEEIVDKDKKIKNKKESESEISQLKRQLQAERSRHYTQKRRATKLDDDYKRVLDRLQQTELNLALQMSECERLQEEMKKLKSENDKLNGQLNENTTNKTAKNVPKQAKRGGTKTKALSPVPVSPPVITKKADTTIKTKKGITQNKVQNNRKRGRPSAPSPDVEVPSPPISADANKPTFNPDDFIPRRAAASKRIRYF